MTVTEIKKQYEQALISINHCELEIGIKLHEHIKQGNTYLPDLKLYPNVFDGESITVDSISLVDKRLYVGPLPSVCYEVSELIAVLANLEANLNKPANELSSGD